MIENRVESLNTAAIRRDGVRPDVEFVQRAHSVPGVQKNIVLPENNRVEPRCAIRKNLNGRIAVAASRGRHKRVKIGLEVERFVHGLLEQSRF